MDSPDDKKLERIFAALGEPSSAPPEDAALAKAWPGIVERARAEADRRDRRSRSWRFAGFGAVALAASLVLALGVARFVHPGSTDDGNTKGGDFSPLVLDALRWDLIRLPVSEDCWRAVGLDDAQKEKATALTDEYRARFATLPADVAPDRVSALSQELRAKIDSLLEGAQHDRFRQFCSEQDKKRSGAPR